MAKTHLKFIDRYDDDSISVIKTNIELYSKTDQVIHIEIACHRQETVWVNLDKSTAIKFAKTLRTEINKITESEASNG